MTSYEKGFRDGFELLVDLMDPWHEESRFRSQVQQAARPKGAKPKPPGQDRGRYVERPDLFHPDGTWKVDPYGPLASPHLHPRGADE